MRASQTRSPAKAGVQPGVDSGSRPLRRRLRRRSRQASPGHWVHATLVALYLSLPSPAIADSLMPPAEYADTQLPDPAQERQAKALMETIRCLVCQGQSIADSDAEMAGDMRALIRQRIRAGESPDQIRRWLISRYGDWVSYAPPLEPATWPLWAAPIVLLLAGGWLVSRRIRRRRN